MNAWCLLQNYPDCFCSQKLGCASWWCVACPSKLWRTIYLRGFQLFLLLVRLDVQLDQIPDRFLASPVSGQACISQSLHRWKWFFFFFVSSYMNMIVNKIFLGFQQTLELAFISEVGCPFPPYEFGLAEAVQLIKTHRI